MSIKDSFLFGGKDIRIITRSFLHEQEILSGKAPDFVETLVKLQNLSRTVYYFWRVLALTCSSGTVSLFPVISEGVLNE